MSTTANIERTLDLKASPERVFRALTSPRELSAWFGQEAEIEEFVEGASGWFGWEGQGRFAFEVVQIQPPTLLVWRWAQQKDTPIAQCATTEVRWTLRPSDAGTRLTMVESGFVKPEQRATNENGWDRELQELVADLNRPLKDYEVVETSRTIERAPADLFAAWTDTARLSAWFCPDGWAIERAVVEAHPGGKLSVAMAAEDGRTWRLSGRFWVVERDKRLVFTWTTAPDPKVEDTLVTIEFVAQRAATVVKVRHEYLDTQAAHDEHKHGWGICLVNLHHRVAV